MGGISKKTQVIIGQYPGFAAHRLLRTLTLDTDQATETLALALQEEN